MKRSILLILFAISYTAHSECPVPWGGMLREGQSVLAYEEQRPPKGEMCRSEYRTCRNGYLTGSYRYTSCFMSESGFSGQDDKPNFGN